MAPPLSTHTATILNATQITAIYNEEIKNQLTTFKTALHDETTIQT